MRGRRIERSLRNRNQPASRGQSAQGDFAAVLETWRAKQIRSMCLRDPPRATSNLIAGDCPKNCILAKNSNCADPILRQIAYRQVTGVVVLHRSHVHWGGRQDEYENREGDCIRTGINHCDPYLARASHAPRQRATPDNAKPSPALRLLWDRFADLQAPGLASLRR